VPSLFPDAEPLRVSRDFRLLWIGQFISQFGSSMRLVAIPYQIYTLTGSTLAVGLVGVFTAVPLITFALWGGVLADRVDRRRMLLFTNVGLAIVSVALALATQFGLTSVPLLYLLTAAGAGIGALDQPARSALAPSLVERRLLPAAISLNQTQFQVGTIIGAASAGVLIAQVGFAYVYWIDAATFIAVIVSLALMRVGRADTSVVHPDPFRSLVEGFTFLRSKPLLISLMLMDFFANIVCTVRPVLPFYADRVFGVGPQGLGLLYAASAVGATVVALTSGWSGSISRRGLGVLVAASLFGLATTAFGLLPPTGFVAALALLAVAEGADIVSAILRRTILLFETPDALRGRLSAINLVFVAGGPQLGQVESGIVAEVLTPQLAVIIGGLACVGVVVATQALVPQVARYRADPEALPASS
jgi:MFS family permease